MGICTEIHRGVYVAGNQQGNFLKKGGSTAMPSDPEGIEKVVSWNELNKAMKYSSIDMPDLPA